SPAAVPALGPAGPFAPTQVHRAGSFSLWSAAPTRRPALRIVRHPPSALVPPGPRHGAPVRRTDVPPGPRRTPLPAAGPFQTPAAQHPGRSDAVDLPGSEKCLRDLRDATIQQMVHFQAVEIRMK